MVEQSVSALLGYQFRKMSAQLGDTTNKDGWIMMDIQYIDGKRPISNSFKGLCFASQLGMSLLVDLLRAF